MPEASRSLAEQGLSADLDVHRTFVKESVLPFNRFPGSDILLGPEMRSTGEVMGISKDYGLAFAKSQAAAGFPVPSGGTAFISVHDFDKPDALPLVQELKRLGFRVLATRGTAAFLAARDVAAEVVYRVNEGRPHCVHLIRSGRIDLVFNTPLGRESFYDDGAIRKAATLHGVQGVTTLSAMEATVQGIKALRERSDLDVVSLQEIHAEAGRAEALPVVGDKA